MKKKLFTLLLGGCLLSIGFSANAKIWRLNNSNNHGLNPAIDADFTGTLQQAHDSAAVLSGDTIHVEQSNASYGGLVMTKKLVIIGSGYFLATNPKTQVNTGYGSMVDAIQMVNSGSAGSLIMGLSIYGNVNMGTNNLTLKGNYFIMGTYNSVIIGSGSSTNIDSINIKGNYFTQCYYAYPIVSNSGTGIVSKVNISNNIFNTTNYYNYPCISLNSNASGIIKNNTLDNSYSANSSLSVSNMYVVNNISTGSGANTFNNCVVEFNLGTINTQYISPSGTGNTISNNFQNATIDFTGAPSVNDAAYTLKPTSPAKGTGKSGQDMGAFGGAIPYVLSGIPTVPNIYSLTIDPISAGATSIQVHVSAKSN